MGRNGRRCVLGTMAAVRAECEASRVSGRGDQGSNLINEPRNERVCDAQQVQGS